MSGPTCPTRQQWSDFLLGLLPADDIARLEEHLQSCPTCAAALEGLNASADSLVDQLRAEAHAPRSELDEDCRRAVERYQEVPSLGSAVLDAIPAGDFSGGLRCPNCHQPIEFGSRSTPKRLSCPSCGSDFQLDPGAISTQTFAAPPHQRVGRYELIESIGSGAFGTVWRGRDVELDREVAVKLPRSGRLEDGDTLERFLREARAAAQLKHPNIVSVHDVGRHDDTLYIVSDLVHGVSLSEWLTGRRPTFGESAEIVACIAEALHYAHRSGVVHRDLKPSNIMLEVDPAPAADEHTTADTAPSTVTARGSTATGGSRPSGSSSRQPLNFRPRIMDFGLAKRDAAEVTVTLDGQILGTPAYMSPEQIRDPHSVEGRSDQYSLGVVLYELLTGELPFRGVTRMVLFQALHDDPRPPRKLNDRIPRDLETITMKCLAKEPGLRYASAQALAEDLRRHLRGEPIHARAVGPAGRVWRWCRRKPAVAALAAAVIVVTIVGFAATWGQSRQAIAASDRAESTTGVALSALHTLIHDVNYGLENSPQARTLRADVLTSAQQELNRLLPLAPDSTQADRLRVMAYRMQGDVHYDRFQFDLAHGQYAEAIRLSDGMPSAELTDQDRIERAFLQLRLAKTYYNRNIASPGTHFELNRAIELLERLVDELPEYDDWVHRNYIFALCSLSNVELRHGNVNAAIDHAERAMSDARRMAARPELAVTGEMGIAAAGDALALSLEAAGRLDEAQEQFDASVSINEKFYALDPTNSVNQQGAAIAFNHYAVFLARRGKLAEARGYFTRCLAILRRLAAADPDPANLSSVYTLAEVATSLERVAEGDGQAYYDAASGFAVLATLFSRPSAPTAGGRQPDDVHGDAVRKAIELLQRANDAGYFHDASARAELAAAPEFDAVRRAPEYEQLELDSNDG